MTACTKSRSNFLHLFLDLDKMEGTSIITSFHVFGPWVVSGKILQFNTHTHKYTQAFDIYKKKKQKNNQSNVLTKIPPCNRIAAFHEQLPFHSLIFIKKSYCSKLLKYNTQIFSTYL